jgi:hypothetical protein
MQAIRGGQVGEHRMIIGSADGNSAPHTRNTVPRGHTYVVGS